MFAVAMAGKGQTGLLPVKRWPTARARELGNQGRPGKENRGSSRARRVWGAQDIEEGRGGLQGGGGGGQAECAASWTEGSVAATSAGASSCGAGVTLSDRSEYIQLHATIERWVAVHRSLRARQGPSASQRAKDPLVPDHIKRKLHRLAALKRKLAQAVCAHASDSAAPPVDGGGAAGRQGEGSRGGCGCATALGNLRTGQKSVLTAVSVTAVEPDGVPEERHQCNSPMHEPTTGARGDSLHPAARRMPPLTGFLTTAAQRLSGRGGQRQAVTVGTAVDRTVDGTAAGVAVAGGTNVGSSSEGDGGSHLRPEAADDRCWICFEGAPILWLAW
jgi:hypothetical protein